MNMDIKASYLEAIQAIAGKVPGEKQKTIKMIAREIAGVRGSKNDTPMNNQDPNFPEPLKPLILVEVAKLLQNRDSIIEAFKSEDLTVLYRAFQAKWFFTGAGDTLIDAKYLVENVFPEISLHARLKIIKRFGIFLQNVSAGAELFTAVSEKYGVDEAIPLLAACDEQFAFDMILEKKINLSERMIQRLYEKYPNLVVKYLMLTEPQPDDVRETYKISIYKYTDFLPYLAIKHFDDFMTLYDMHNGLNVKLGKKAAITFIAKCTNRLIENPKQYLKLVPLNLVSRKLSADDFTKMFQNLFPKEKEKFRFSELYKSLCYFKTSNAEKVDSILSMFQKVYGEDLLKCHDLVSPELMRLLPPVARADQARLKLESDKDWRLYDKENSWRCYLPTSESIPLIKTEIGRSSDDSKRCQLVKLMVYTCKINNDRNAVLTTLNYVYDRHRNERNWFLFDFLSEIQSSIDLFTLTAEHWVAINKYIKLAEIQDKLSDNSSVILCIIEDALHYCFLNDVASDDYVQMHINFALESWYGKWNILTNYPNWEKKCLDLFINAIPKQCLFDDEFWTTTQTIKITLNLASALYQFNKRNSKSKEKLKYLSIRDYPWLFEKIENFMLSDWKEKSYHKESLLDILRINEKDLFELWLQDIEHFRNLNISILLYILRMHPQKMLDHWKECFDKLQGEILPNAFVTKCLWYQDLPIKFFDAALEQYRVNENIVTNVSMLAMMLDGQTFTEIITPVIPTDDKFDIDADRAKDTYRLLLVIASHLRKVNPPVSLDVIGSFCVGDYLQMALRSLFSVCSRVPASTVISFAKVLTDRRVSVMKHGIRLMYMVSPLQDLYNFLIGIWKNHAHMSIRAVVLKKIYDLFFQKPDSESWDMIRTCIETLGTYDDPEIFESLILLQKVPNEYIGEYIKTVLDVLEKLRNSSEDPASDAYFKLSCKLIRNINSLILNILSEDYAQQLIRTYLFDFNYNAEIFKCGKELTNSYLLASEVYDDSRFNFFASYFQDTVKKYWNKPHPQDSKFYPVNFMVHDLLQLFVQHWSTNYDPKIFERLLEIFTSALLPTQDMGSYVNLVYCVEFYNSQTPQEFGTRISQSILRLIDIFTVELTVHLGMQLEHFLEDRSLNDTSNEEFCMDVTESLTANGNIHCAVIAAMLLPDCSTEELSDRSDNVISALRCYDHPAVASVLSTYLNTNEYAV